MSKSLFTMALAGMVALGSSLALAETAATSTAPKPANNSAAPATTVVAPKKTEAAAPVVTTPANPVAPKKQ